MSPRDTSSKITPEHLSRQAVVYLRQSSLAQVKQKPRVGVCNTR